jgi:cell division protein ZapD
MADNFIVYEQPLNELIRVCLRLEQLFFQIDHQIKDTSPLGTRTAIATILNLLHLLDRPDLKAKLAKELSHQVAVLTRLENTPEIDQKKLKELLKKLDHLVRIFIDSSGKIGQNLRDVDLLNNLRLHLATPGGGCSFDIPVYHFWLHQPSEDRQATIKTWLAEFENVRLALSLLLQLVREGCKIQTKTAQQGFYQELLDPQINLKLIRVSLSPKIQAYPEISVGRHFLGVRFFIPNIQERPTQYLHDLEFKLSYCIS